MTVIERNNSGDARTDDLAELRKLADLIAKKKGKIAVKTLGNRFPIGVAWSYVDDRMILINEDGRALWQRWPDGKIEPADPNERHDPFQVFFDEAETPYQQQFLGLVKLRDVLVQWGLIRRRKSDKVPSIPPSAPPLKTNNAPSKGEHVAGPFAAFSKNFLNYPMARDLRSRDWKRTRDKKTGERIVKFADDDLRYRFGPAVDLDLVRPPTAFDLNVLLLVIATAQQRKNDQVIFQSRSEMLRALGYGSDRDNRQRLVDSLKFWSEVSIRVNRWYLTLGERSPDHRPFKHTLKKLRPPIIEFAFARKVTLKLHTHWRKVQFFAKLPLPLPRSAAAQNIVLAVLASFNVDADGETQPRRVRPFCRKIGLNHTRRNAVLARALDEAVAWFQQRSGELTYALSSDGTLLTFRMRKPHKARKRLLKQRPVTHDEIDPEGQE